MKNGVFTKEHTQIAKGFALILMLFDHLFWMDYGNYISIFPKLPDGHSLEWAIGSIGNICVAMFLFLSGYGMFFAASKKERYSIKDSLKRVKKIWLDFAAITVVLILIDLACGKIVFDPIRIVLNILALDYTYNKFAWFMLVYIVIIMVLPLFVRLFKKIKWWNKLLIIAGIKVAITAINWMISQNFDIPEVLYKALIEPFMLISIFLIGYFVAQHKVYEKIHNVIKRILWPQLFCAVLLVLALIIMYFYQYTILDHITAPVLCFLFSYSVNCSIVRKTMAYIGGKSMYIWLIHYPIMVILLNKVIYSVKYSVLIILWLLFLTILLSEFYLQVKKIIKRGTENERID